MLADNTKVGGLKSVDVLKLDEHPASKRRAELVGARIPPVLAVVTVDMNVLGWSPSMEVSSLISESRAELESVVRKCVASAEQIIHITDDDVILRIIPLESLGVECVVIMIESFGHRGSLEQTAKAYRLTKREAEILSYVVQGLSNSEIAEILFIANSTVSDHLKSLLRKTQSSKRIHLLSKIAYGPPS